MPTQQQIDKALKVDDDAQPTINSSLTAPTLGLALTTTTILLQ